MHPNDILMIPRAQTPLKYNENTKNTKYPTRGLGPENPKKSPPKYENGPFWGHVRIFLIIFFVFGAQPPGRGFVILFLFFFFFFFEILGLCAIREMVLIYSSLQCQWRVFVRHKKRKGGNQQGISIMSCVFPVILPCYGCRILNQTLRQRGVVA